MSGTQRARPRRRRPVSASASIAQRFKSHCCHHAARRAPPDNCVVTLKAPAHRVMIHDAVDPQPHVQEPQASGMQRRAVRITTLFEKPSSSSRSPLSPIVVPNEAAALKARKSIREVAAERRHKMALPGSPDTHPTSRRRSVKLWGSRVEPSAAEASTSSSPEAQEISFKWVRGEMLGKGTRGRVYLGLNATTGEMLAVKQLNFSGKPESPGRASRRTVKREMQTMQSLSHPSLVEWLGFEEQGEHLSLFTEYVPGGSIRDNRAKHGRFTEDLVKRFASQILHGLIYLHSQGVVHGNLKSTKILVETDGVCKIGGLGCSATDLRDNSNAVPGAVFWTAPEVIRTQYKEYDAKADIWSLGCLVLEMLTGKRPWFDQEAVAVMFKLYQQTEAPRAPPDVTLSPVAADFVESCLALDPGDRMTAVQLQQHPFLVLPPDWTFEGFRPAGLI